MVVQGTYEGFRLIDVTFPTRPREIINYEECAPDSTAGNQGTWSSTATSLSAPGTRRAHHDTPVTCDGQPVPGGFEGLHIFHISNKQDRSSWLDRPRCGSHTASGVPDLANNRLLIYNGSSSGACENIDIIGVPLSTRPRPPWSGQEPTAGPSVPRHRNHPRLGDEAGLRRRYGFEIFSLAAADGAASSPTRCPCTTSRFRT